MKKIITIICILTIFFGSVIPVAALTDNEVRTRISETQSIIPLWTPLAPPGNDQKGSIGEIISNIFDAIGMIKNQFITAFQIIEGNFSGNIPRWDWLKFVEWTINDNGTNVGVGTVSPIELLDVNGKIRMRTQTDISDADDIVATKKYVDDAISWVSSGSGGTFTIEDFTLLVNGDHTVADCIVEWWTPVRWDGTNGFTQDGQSFCKFTAVSCPMNWTQNSNWLQTVAGPSVRAVRRCSWTFCSRRNYRTDNCPTCNWSNWCARSITVVAASCSSWRCGTRQDDRPVSACTIEEIGCF